MGHAQTQRDGKGAWLPDELLARYGEALGPKGLWVYCNLLAFDTLRKYPTVEELASRCKMSKAALSGQLATLRAFGLLNDFDLAAIKKVP